MRYFLTAFLRSDIEKEGDINFYETELVLGKNDLFCGDLSIKCDDNSIGKVTYPFMYNLEQISKILCVLQHSDALVYVISIRYTFEHSITNKNMKNNIESLMRSYVVGLKSIELKKLKIEEQKINESKLAIKNKLRHLGGLLS